MYWIELMTDHIDTAEERSSKLECITIETV